MTLMKTLAVVATLALLASGGVEAAVQSSDGLNRRVRVHNQTGLTVQRLQAADVRTGEYAPDLLAGSPLEAGSSRPVVIDAGTNACLFDLRAELSSGQVLVRENLNVCRIADYYLTR
jgi:hypothetical protein